MFGFMFGVFFGGWAVGQHVLFYQVRWAWPVGACSMADGRWWPCFAVKKLERRATFFRSRCFFFAQASCARLIVAIFVLDPGIVVAAFSKGVPKQDPQKGGPKRDPRN